MSSIELKFSLVCKEQSEENASQEPALESTGRQWALASCVVSMHPAAHNSNSDIGPSV